MTAIVDYNLGQFVGTGNPVYAWYAYRHARRNGEAVPEEVLRYLDAAADRILGMASGPAMGTKERLAEVAEALDLHTAKPFKRYRRDQKFLHFINLMQESLMAYMDEKNGELEGWEDYILGGTDNEPGLAKKAGISKSTARRLMKDFLSRERNQANAATARRCHE